MGRHALLQGIFLTQGSNPCLMSPALAGRFFTTEPCRQTNLGLTRVFHLPARDLRRSFALLS